MFSNKQIADILGDEKIDNILNNDVNDSIHLVKEHDDKEISSNEIKMENDTLLISEKTNSVFLPYSEKEINQYLEQFPDKYESYKDVVNQEFILPLNYFMRHPFVARFRESYSLVRDKESKPVFDSIKFAMDMIMHYDINPAIISACKSQDQLERYIECLEKNDLDSFKDFKIVFEVTPLKHHKHSNNHGFSF